MQNFKKVLGVFFGGRSCEHDVSIITGLQMLMAVPEEKYQAIPIYIDPKGRWYTGNGLKDIRLYTDFSPDAPGIIPVSLDLTPGSGALLTYIKAKGLFKGTEQKIVARIDCALLAFHGAHGEDGCIQGVMEMANIPYTSGGVCASALTMDKIMFKDFLKGAGLPVVPGIWFYRSRWERDAQGVLDEIEKFSLPVVVKPASLGSSIGVTYVKTPQKLQEALDTAFSFDRKVLVEKAIEQKIELNCAVLGYEDKIEASVIEKPPEVDGLLDYEIKYGQKNKNGSAGMAALAREIPAPISDELKDRIQIISKQIFNLLDLKGVVRIDYMEDIQSHSLYVTEVNTIPGSMAYYLWEHSGLRYGDLIDRLVQYAFKAHEQKNSSSYAYISTILEGVQLDGIKGVQLDGIKMESKGTKL